jgi:16S rRNA G966 N2-methylase RsmD
VQELASARPEPADLILADPPYRDAAAADAIAAVVDAGWLRRGGLLALEHSRRAPAPDKLGSAALERTRRQGDGVISLYRALDPPPDSTEVP